MIDPREAAMPDRREQYLEFRAFDRAILAPRSGFIVAGFGIAAVVESAAPGCGVRKWSKIPGSRRAGRHDRATKYLIIKSLLAELAVAMRFFPAFFPYNRE